MVMMTAEQKRRLLMEQLRDHSIGGGATPLEATQANIPNKPPATGNLSGKNIAEIAALRRKPTNAMDAIMAASSPTMFTALAKGAVAGFAGHKGRKERAEEATKMTKSMQKIADQEARELERKQDLEDKTFAIRREQADRQKTVHLERNLTNDIKMFEAINPGLQRGSKEYGAALGAYQKDQETNYGTRGTSGGGSTSAIIQRHDRWKEENPGHTQKESSRAYDKILSSYRSTNIAGVERFVTDPEDPLSGKSIEESQTDELSFAANKKRAEQAGKNTADMSLEMASEIESVRATVTQMESILENEDFDDAVGWWDGWIGQMSQNFGFDEGLLGRKVEMFADGITLQQSKFFKGNLNQKEIDILENSKPKRGDDEALWRTWFKDYKKAYDTAMHNYAVQPNRYLEQNVPIAGGGRQAAGTPQDPIILD